MSTIGGTAVSQQSEPERNSASETASNTRLPTLVLKSIDGATFLSCNESLELPAMLGRYRVDRELGRGAMGAVFLAYDTELKRFIALKFQNTGAADKSRSLARFQREARSAAVLTHPNLCRVYDIGEYQGLRYIAMEYIEGKRLSMYIAADAIRPRQAATVVQHLAQGLATAHKNEIIHRDVKPDNILINQVGEPVLTDFGLARDNYSGSSSTTQVGVILGSPAYMSPEQAAGNLSAMGPTSDIYSLGVVFYEMLTGQLPFRGAVTEVLASVLMSQPKLIRELRPAVPPGLAAICERMMAKQQQERYQSMGEVAQALREWFQSTLADSAELAVTGPAGPQDPSGLVSLVSADLTCDTEPILVSIEPTIELASPVAPNVAGTPAIQVAGPQHASSSLWGEPDDIREGGSRGALGRRLLAGMAVSAVVVCSIIVYFKVNTGLVRIEVDDPRASVLIDGSKATINAAGIGEVRLSVGEHEYSVERGGAVVRSSSKFEITRSGRKLLSIQLQEAGAAPVAATTGVAAPNVPVSEAVGDSTILPARVPFDAKQARAFQDAAALRYGVPVEYKNSLGMRFRLIPPGEYLMGSTPEEIEEWNKIWAADTEELKLIPQSEGPQHPVKLSEPFYLAVHEVTQRDFESVLGRNPSSFHPTSTNVVTRSGVQDQDVSLLPVDTVNWQDAVEFCEKLTQLESRGVQGYRLPTEAEWEFACRAGTITRNWAGDTEESALRGANFRKRSPLCVGSLEANPFGLHDMLGNVWEWVYDWWDPEYYGRYVDGPVSDPKGPETGGMKCLRGGSWGQDLIRMRSAIRFREVPKARNAGFGFRVALPVSAGK